MLLHFVGHIDFAGILMLQFFVDWQVCFQGALAVGARY